MGQDQSVKVWDPIVRVFHWVLVMTFAIAYIIEEEFLTVHTWLGYTITCLLLIRIPWGLVGSRHARFSDFRYPLAVVAGFVKDSLHLRAKRYLGHNPAAGVMVLLLLGSLFMTVLSGMINYGIEENAGPLASLYTVVGHGWGDVAEEIHEFFANFTLLLVLIHVTGVVVESLIHRENLILSMITGYKRALSPTEESRTRNEKRKSDHIVNHSH